MKWAPKSWVKPSGLAEALGQAGDGLAGFEDHDRNAAPA